jgi:G3E family GTPase
LIETDFSRVPLSEILGTNRFDFEKAHQNPIWYKELNGFRDHVPESLEYGIKSFVYRESRPFDPKAFKAFLDTSWPGVIRAKGFFWLATRPQWVGEVSQAGALVRTEAAGFWWAAIKKESWPHEPDWEAWIAKRWDPVWGDRRQEIVFIGTGMDESAIRSALDLCLIPAEKPDFAAWSQLPDPFPVWRKQKAA